MAALVNIYKYILDSTQENTVLLDDQYKIICYNPTIQKTLQSYFGKLIQEGDDYRDFVVEASMELFLRTFEKALLGETVVVEHETIGPGFILWFQYKMNPVFDDAGNRVGILLSAKDITERKHYEMELKKKNLELSLINKVHDVVHNYYDIDELLSNVCNTLADEENYKLIWVAKVPDVNDSEQKIIPWVAAGLTDYLNHFTISMKDITQQRLPVVTCLRFNKPVVLNRLLETDDFKPKAELAKQFGFGSSMVVPLKLDDQLIGCLSIYADQPDAFDEDQQKVFIRISNIVSKAISNIHANKQREIARYELKERVKELKIIHAVGNMIQNENQPVDELLSNLVEIIPSGWQHHVKCSAKVVFDNKEFFSSRYKPSSIRQSVSLLSLDGKTGSIEIFYDDTLVESNGNFFLPEEIELLKTIADMFIGFYNKSSILSELKRTQANLMSVFDHTNIGYLLIDRELNILVYNKAFYNESKRMTGVKIRNGVNWLLLLPDNRRAYVRSKIEQLIIDKKPLVYETEYEYNLEKTFYTIMLAPIIENENVIGFVVSAIDVTERKVKEFERQKLIDDIIQRNRNLEQFAYIVSHNLRAPVANIMGLARLSKTKTLSDTDRFTIANGLEVSTEKLDIVIRDLDETLKVRSQITEAKQMVSFVDIVNEIKNAKKELIESTKTVINTNFNAVASVETIKSFMINIFSNIIRNSIKHSRQGIHPRIDIWTERKEFEILIHFNDNGIGIDLTKYRDQLFGLYKRFNMSTDGRGIGLFMVKHQVEALNGKIELDSTPDVGTHIVITLSLDSN